MLDVRHRTRTPAYVAFDLLWLDGADLRPMALGERRRVLQSILPEGSPIISVPVSVTGRGCEFFELMCAHDLEGIVAKRLADPYEPRAATHPSGRPARRSPVTQSSRTSGAIK